MNEQKEIKSRNKAFFWLAATGIFITFLWLFNAILLPFILGIAVAYLLDPLMERLVAWKFPRWAAALFILFLFFLVVLILLAVAVPILFGQLQELIAAGPGIMERSWSFLTPYVERVQNLMGQSNMTDYRQALQENMAGAFRIGGGVLAGLASGGMAVAGFVTTMIVAPIVAFFMMKQWPDIRSWVRGLIPRDHYETVTSLLAEMDQKLAGFVRGQLLVALILGLAYAVALTIAGLNFGFLIGLGAGLLSLIPLLGSTVGLVVSVIVAWFQSHSLGYAGMIAGIFFAGQIIEGNIITPRILGKNVGLHPLWILFAVMAGASLFGVAGMLLAVPVTAVIGVLVSFGARQYRKSPFYTSSSPALEAAPADKANEESA